MNKQLLLALTVLVLLGLVSPSLLAQGNFTSASSGNWNTAGTWTLTSGTDADGVPDANDNVIIATGHTISLNNALPSLLAPASLALSINGSGVLDFPSSLVTLTVNGALTMDGTSQITATGGGGTLNASSTFNVAATATNARIAGFTFTVSGATLVSGTFVINSNTGIKTFIGGVSNSGSGSWTSTSVVTPGNLIFRGGIVNSGTSFSAGGATFNTNAQAISGTTATSFANNVAIAAIVVTNSNTGNFTVTGTTTLTGAGGFTDSNNSGIDTFVGNVSLAGTSTFTTTSVTTTGNLIFRGGISNSGTSFSAGGATFDTNAQAITGATSLSFANNVAINGITLTNSSTGTFTVTGTTTLTNGGFTDSDNTSADIFVGNVSQSGTSAFNTTAVTTNGNLIFRGGITNNGGTFTAGAADFTTNSQALAGTNDISFANYVNVTGVTVTNNNTLSVSLTRVSGGGSTLNGTGTWTQGANSTLNYTGDALSITTFNSTSSGNTVNYNGAAQTILATSYYNLTYSGTSSPVVTTASIAGDLTMTTGSFSPSGTITFNGSATAQNINGPGTFSFTSVILNTGTTNLNVNKSISLTGTLTLSTNRIVVVNSSSNITLGGAASIVSTPGFSSTCYIQLDGTTGTNSNIVFTAPNWPLIYPIGTSTGGYTPVTFSSITNAPTAGSTLSVKAIYNNSDQGQLRRVFRFVVGGNAVTTTFFTTGTFKYNNTTDISTGDAESNYTTEWYLATASATAAWTATTIASPTNQFVVAGGSTATSALTSGTFYYTIGQSSAYPNTWYSYQTGVWSNWQNWTSDPSGSSLVNGLNLPPQPGDAIVILNGTTITNDVSGQVATTTTINAGATLDMSTTTGNTLGTVSGSGLLRVGAASASVMALPTGTYSSFTTAGTGGTIEYYNVTPGSYTLPSSQTSYNNLKFTTISSTVTFVEGADLTINGSFNITSSSTGIVTWQIGDGTFTGTSKRTISVAGDLTVSANGAITVSGGNTTSNSPHAITLSGNFTNNGSVRLFDNTASTNLLSDANWATATVANSVYFQTTRGFGTAVTFSSVNDQTITCNGITYFYQLIMDKGTGTQAVLNINSSSTTNFRLYGPANLGSSGQTSTDYSLCALSIKNGTLELSGSINIPSLIENGAAGATSTDNFSLPVSGQLWLNGSGVTVTITSNLNGNDDQRLNVEGILLITNGTLNCYGSKGLGSGQAGSVVIQGGTTNISQFRPRGGSPTQAFSYIQTGGTVNIGTTGYNGTVNILGTGGPGGIDNTGYGRISIPVAGCTFQMSGGSILNIGSPTSNSPGGIEIASSSANYSVTGGTVNAYIPSTGNNFTINSTAPLYNLNIYREGTGAALTAQLQAALTVVNNLTIVTGNTPTFNCNTNNLFIGGNLSINNGTTFTPSTGTLTFNGTSSQTLAYGSSPSATNPSITSFSTVVVNKSAGTLSLSFPNTTFTTLPSTNVLPTIPTLTLTSGTFNDGGSTVTVSTTLTNNAIHTSAGSGGITYSAVNGTIAGTNGTFGNLTLTGTNSTTATSGGQTVTGNLQLNGATKSILNIISNSLTVNGNITTSQNAGALAANWCIQTSGLHNAGGLTRTCIKGSALTFPVGSNGLYTPNTITVNTATTVGTITVRPVNSEHPNVTKTGTSLQYYWRVTSSGFVGLGTTSGSIVHSSYIFSTATKGTSSANYVAARYDRTANTWGQCTSTNTMTTTILPNPFNTGNAISTWTGVTGDQLDGEYTCGNGTASGTNNAFGSVTTYYSRTGSTASPASWIVSGTWSTDPVLKNAGASCACDPTACPTCPVIIGDGGTNNHTVFIPTGIAAGTLQKMCGSLTVSSGSTLDCGTNPTSATALGFGTSTGGSVSGTGTIRVSSSTATGFFPSGDFTNFIGSSGGTVEYYGSTFTIPSTYTSAVGSQTLGTYYNLIINPTGTITMPATNLIVYNNFTSGTVTTFTGTTITNGARTISIAGNMTIAAGTFNFANGGVTTLTVTGNILNSGTLAVVAGGTTHTISTPGSITNNGTMTLRNTSFANITFTGSNNVTFGGSGATTLNLVTVNKGTSQTPTVTCSLSGTLSTPSTAAGWLTLTNGAFDFQYTGATSPITLSSSSYSIPSTAKLKVEAGTVQITSASGGANDLFLNGTLEVAQLDVTHSGTVYTNTATATGSDNDIEYASTGTPTITVSNGGTLTVDGSIRRSTTTLTGALVYNQTGGTVTVGANASGGTRGAFEIDFNTGSSFTLTGSSILTVQRQTQASGNTGYADVYINPVSSNVSSTSTIAVGLTTATTQSNLRVNIAPSIGNFTVLGPGANANPQTVKLYSNPMILGGNLTITTPSILITNSLDVSIAGNLAVSGTGTGANSGTYTGGTNTTTFNGAANQTALLTSPSTFNNITINNTGSSGNKTVQLVNTSTAPTLNNLNVLSGIFDVNNLALNVNGNITNNASQTASAGGSITITTSTTASHTITSSNGSFTNLNIGGTTATTNNLVTVTGNMTINGYLDFVSTSTTVTRTLLIQSNLLTVANGTLMKNVGNFRFIKTNGVSSDLGMLYTWGTSGTPISFTYPLGTRTNYTPVTMNFNSVATGGNYTVIPVDGQHPTASPSGQDLLSYYWKVINGGVVSSTTGTLTFTFPTALISGSGVGTGFLGAYLDLGASNITSPTWGWQLNGSSGVGGSFQFTGPFSAGSYPGSYPTAEMPTSGYEFDYTCGTSATLPNPIAPVYSRFGTTSPTNTTSVGTASVGGNWSLATNWTISSTGYGPALSSVPTGVPVVILPGARINMDVAGQSAFTTQISGLLVINSSGESLGTISGTGTMRTTNSALPAGTYTTFTSSSGGTIEYATTMTMNSRTIYNNLLISSDYVSTLPSTVTMTASNLVINGNLTVASGNTLDDSANGSGQGGISVAGNFSNSGNYIAGTSTAIGVTGNLVNGGTFTAGSSTVSITGNLVNSGTFTGGSSLVNLSGNLSNSGTFSPGTGTVTFNGTNAQTITGSTSFNNLTINNTFATSPQLTISSGNQTVNSTLTMTKGNVNLNSTTITLGASCASPGTLSHSLASAAGWMYGGSITRYFTTTAIPDGSVTGYFPIGTSTNYKPFFIGVPAGDMTTCGTFTVGVSSLTTTSIVSIPDATDPTSPIVVQYQGSWSVSSSAITGGTYDLIAGGTGFGTIGNLADLSLCKATSVVGTYVAASNTTADPRLTRTGLQLTDLTTTDGNQFFVGSTNAITSPLPIELLSFTGEAKKFGVELQWKTASETNNDYFTILHSSAGVDFETIGTVKGNGTTKSSHSYSLIDYKPFLGQNYYRLKQTDLDGHTTLSETIVVDVLNLDPLVSVYPNPLKQNQLLNVIVNGLQANSATEIQIINLQGTKVNGATINTDADGTLKASVAIHDLSSGLYILKVQNVYFKFVIE